MPTIILPAMSLPVLLLVVLLLLVLLLPVLLFSSGDSVYVRPEQKLGRNKSCAVFPAADTVPNAVKPSRFYLVNSLSENSTVP